MVVLKKEDITFVLEINGITIEFFILNLSMRTTAKNQIICFTSRS